MRQGEAGAEPVSGPVGRGGAARQDEGDPDGRAFRTRQRSGGRRSKVRLSPGYRPLPVERPSVLIAGNGKDSELQLRNQLRLLHRQEKTGASGAIIGRPRPGCRGGLGSATGEWQFVPRQRQLAAVPADAQLMTPRHVAGHFSWLLFLGRLLVLGRLLAAGSCARSSARAELPAIIGGWVTCWQAPRRASPISDTRGTRERREKEKIARQTRGRERAVTPAPTAPTAYFAELATPVSRNWPRWIGVWPPSSEAALAADAGRQLTPRARSDLAVGAQARRRILLE